MQPVPWPVLLCPSWTLRPVWVGKRMGQEQEGCSGSEGVTDASYSASRHLARGSLPRSQPRAAWSTPTSGRPGLPQPRELPGSSALAFPAARSTEDPASEGTACSSPGTSQGLLLPHLLLARGHHKEQHKPGAASAPFPSLTAPSPAQRSVGEAWASPPLGRGCQLCPGITRETGRPSLPETTPALATGSVVRRCSRGLGLAKHLQRDAWSSPAPPQGDQP